MKKSTATEPTSSGRLDKIVMQDIVSSMRKIEIERPIVNHASFATKILWDIFEASSDHFENWKEVEKLNDDDIEYIFKQAFPIFLKAYPEVLVLDA